MKANKELYYILSGEGECGTWQRVYSTARGIKGRLTRERCGGDRWARAYGNVRANEWGRCGTDIESGETREVGD